MMRCARLIYIILATGVSLAAPFLLLALSWRKEGPS